MTIEEHIQEDCKYMNLVQFREYMLELELDLMDLIVQKKLEDGKIVFSEVENGYLN